MNITELKEKLTKFDEVNTSAFTFKVWTEQTGFDSDMASAFMKGARYQHSQDAKTITALLEIIEDMWKALSWLANDSIKYKGTDAGSVATKTLTATELKLKELGEV